MIKIKKEDLRKESKKNNKKSMLTKTNIDLLTKLINKKRNTNLEFETKESIKFELQKNHLKNFPIEKKIVLSKENISDIFLFKVQYCETKNKLLDQNHGYIKLSLFLKNAKKGFLSLHLIVSKMKQKRYDAFFTNLFFQKVQKKSKDNFLQCFRKICDEKIIENRKKAFLELKSFSITFDLYNNLYHKIEFNWKKGVFKILEDFENRPKLLFSIAQKNPFYFKFLVFFKLMKKLINSKQKLAFELMKLFWSNNRKQMLVSESENLDFGKKFENKRISYFSVKSFEKQKSLQIKNKSSQAPEYLLEDTKSKFSEKEFKNINEKEENFKISNQAIYISQENEFLTFKNKNNKIRALYGENIDSSNKQEEERKTKLNIIENSSENLNQKKTFNYKEIIARRYKKNSLQPIPQKIEISEEILIKKKNSSKIIFLILKDMINKRLKSALFFISNVKRTVKSEKIIYAKVQMLKRPIQYKIDVNEDDLKSMNIPFPSNTSNLLKISKIKR
jgi:hypothetical protein